MTITGAARAAHAHPCLSSAASFHGAFQYRLANDRYKRSAALFTLPPSGGNFNGGETTNFNMPTQGGIISLWAVRPQFHRPPQTVDRCGAHRRLTPPLKLLPVAILSEHRTFERGHWIWKQVRNRANHYFDCEAMQVAVATMLKLVGQESVKDAE